MLGTKHIILLFVSVPIGFQASSPKLVTVLFLQSKLNWCSKPGVDVFAFGAPAAFVEEGKCEAAERPEIETSNFHTNR